MVEQPQGFRGQLASDLGERHSKVLDAVDRALAGKQKTWVHCPHCRKKSEVEVEDVRGALLAASFLADQSLGKPGTADPVGDSDGEKIVFERVVYLDESDANRVFAAAEKYVPAESLAAFRLEACGGAS